MSGQQQSQDGVEVMIRGSRAYIRVNGRGTFNLSAAVKDFGENALDHEVKEFVFDMSNCQSMDSTFMGMAAGLAMRCRKMDRGPVWMVNLSDRTLNLMSTLGLDYLIRTAKTEATAPDMQADLIEGQAMSRLAIGDSSRHETSETILKAHENLVKASPDNLPRFKDVIDFLREDLKKGNGSGASGGA